MRLRCCFCTCHLHMLRRASRGTCACSPRSSCPFASPVTRHLAARLLLRARACEGCAGSRASKGARSSRLVGEDMQLANEVLAAGEVEPGGQVEHAPAPCAFCRWPKHSHSKTRPYASAHTRCGNRSLARAMRMRR